MKLRTPIQMPPSNYQISHDDKILLVGSCFTEHIGSRFQQNKFTAMQNPFGTVFHPAPIDWLLAASIQSKQIKEPDLGCMEGLYFHDNFHYAFSDPNPQLALHKMNSALKETKTFLQDCTHVFLSFGSAIAYEKIRDRKIVSNCHKQNNALFNRKLSSLIEIESYITRIIGTLQSFNSNLEIILTVSPVRHLKEGMIENNASKSVLRAVCESCVRNNDRATYFPSYEILMDDLRDYRFYKDDLLHPNEIAQEYIWDIFKDHYFNQETKELVTQIEKIKKAIEHKPMHEASEAHLKFKAKQLNKIVEMKRSYPWLDLHNEQSYFES